MKKCFIFLLIFLNCSTQTTQIEINESSKDTLTFQPATTIKSDYEKLSEGDKKSYKLRKYWIQNSEIPQHGKPAASIILALSALWAPGLTRIPGVPTNSRNFEAIDWRMFSSSFVCRKFRINLYAAI